ncbi:MAG: helix-turn-helix transcriptional regulator [Clostridia bacterium]|nr:helix-turn-helix transcriptional regulator [Clostridia bacterium]
MELGSQIKKYRNRKGLTQEALAEYLNITVSAISQWESGRTMPDLSLLPPLCVVLGVTSDELLGIDLAKREERIEEIVREARENPDEGDVIFADGLKQFPDSHTLMWWWLMSTDDTDRVIALGEKLLAESTDDPTRSSVIFSLSHAYLKKGFEDRAYALAKHLPGLWHTSDVLSVQLKQHKGAAYVEESRSLRFALLTVLTEAMRYGTVYADGFFTDEELRTVEEKAAALMDLFFEDGDVGFFHGALTDAHRRIARYSVRLGEPETALEHLRLAAEHARAWDAGKKSGSFTHTSLLFRGMESWSSSGGSAAEELLEAMAEEDFDPVRDSPEFRETEAKLRA